LDRVFQFTEGMTRTNFIHSLEHVSVIILSEDNKPKKLPIYELWLKYPLPRTYDKMVFDPNPAHKHDPHSGICNLFRGFVTEPVEGDITPFLEYIDPYANGDKEGANWILNWCAHLFQFPHIIPETALVSRGIEGIGKSFLFKVLKLLLSGKDKSRDLWIEAKERMSSVNFQAT
jgi:hypothetical protein